MLPACVASPLYVPPMLCAPDLDGVKVTEQLPPLSVQDLELKMPTPPVQFTVPVGVFDGMSVSVRCAVHLVPWCDATGLGAQPTLVLVVSPTRYSASVWSMVPLNR